MKVTRATALCAATLAVAGALTVAADAASASSPVRTQTFQSQGTGQLVLVPQMTVLRVPFARLERI